MSEHVKYECSVCHTIYRNCRCFHLNKQTIMGLCGIHKNVNLITSVTPKVETIKVVNQNPMHLFELVREEDVSGVSGTGVVAEGVMFGNGQIAMNWWRTNKAASIAVYNSLSDLLAIHGHDGKTKIVFLNKEN